MKGKIKTTLLIAIFILAMIPVLPTAAQEDFTVDVSGVEEHPKPILYKLEHLGTGSAEWVLTYANTGESSVKLIAPTGGDYGKIILPMEMAFSALADFSCYVTADGANDLPLLEIELLGITDDVIVGGTFNVPAEANRINIASQPEDFGPLKTDETATTWELYGTHSGSGIDVSGAAWNVFWTTADGEFDQSSPTLFTWAQIHAAFNTVATVKDVRVELRYPPAASTVYVDDITINGKTYTPEQSGVQVGNVLTVSGTGVTAGEVVEIGWDGLKSWDGEDGILNTTEADSDGTYECTLEVPETPTRDHYIWARDTNTGATARSAPILVAPKIKLSPSSGLLDDKVTITGYGYTKESDLIDVTFGGTLLETLSPGTPTTDELGSWTATFKVPKDAGKHDIVAMDEKGYTATKEFTVGAGISLDVDEGPTGTVVEIDGRGFEEYTIGFGDVIVYGDITIDEVACYILDLPTGGIKVDEDGEFSCEIVIPQVSKVGDYTITVDPDDDGIGNIATADF